MKRLFLTAMFVIATLAAQAGGYRGHGGFHGWDGHHGWGGGGSRFSFYWGGGYPLYSTWYSPGYYYSYPSYDYGYDYDYARPNYAANGLFSGALIGGLIGDSIHHQGWEGAGIGAAAGLLLGSAAEANARSYERTVYSVPAATYSYSQPAIQDAPTVNMASTVSDAPKIQSAATYRPTSSMGSANALFGR